MKWFGTIKDKKDLTTKEYVDNADEALKKSTEKSMSDLDKSKVSVDDVSVFSPSEILEMWNSHMK